jgi:hypothetical protein
MRMWASPALIVAIHQLKRPDDGQLKEVEENIKPLCFARGAVKRDPRVNETAT